MATNRKNTSIFDGTSVDWYLVDTRTLPAQIMYVAGEFSVAAAASTAMRLYAQNGIILGKVGTASNLIFEESASINGQGGNTITLGVSGDVFNLNVSGVTYNLGTVAGNPTFSGNVTITGTLTVNGATTTINAATLTVDDKNIELGSVASPTDTTANGGGITLKGTTDKTINWDSTNANWTSSENWNLVTGKVFKINNVSVLTTTALGSSVVGSSLTSVGTLTSLSVTGAITSGGKGTFNSLQSTTGGFECGGDVALRNNLKILNAATTSWVTIGTRNDADWADAVYDLTNIGTISTFGVVAIGGTSTFGAQLYVNGSVLIDGAIISTSTGGSTFGGAITASGFSGPLTGSVTGNVSGSSGSCTGNSATASNLTTAGAKSIYLHRDTSTCTGISFYASNYRAWCIYMGPASQAGSGPTGDITTPAGGALVTGWALRSFVESNSGYGWIFESGSSSGNPVIVAEIRSSDGAAKFYGALTVGGGVTAAGALIEIKNNAPEFRFGATQGFGTGMLSFYSDRGLTNEWRPGYISTSDDGSFTGVVNIYTNGSGSGNKLGSVLGFSVTNGAVRCPGDITSATKRVPKIFTSVASTTGAQDGDIAIAYGTVFFFFSSVWNEMVLA